MESKKPIYQFAIYLCALFLLVGVMTAYGQQDSYAPGETSNPESTQINVDIRSYLDEQVNQKVSERLGTSSQMQESINAQNIALGGYQIDETNALTTPSAFIGSQGLNLNGTIRNQWPGLTNGTGHNESGFQVNRNVCDITPTQTNCACQKGFIAIDCGNVDAGSACSIDDGVSCNCTLAKGAVSDQITTSCLKLNY